MAIDLVGDPDHDDPEEGTVGLAVTALVMAEMSRGLARSSGDRRDPAPVGPGGLGAEQLGIVAAGHQRGYRRVRADAEEDQ